MHAINFLLEQIRAGTGGGEAALWASDLFKMYQRFAEVQKWTWKTLELYTAESGGLKEALVQVTVLYSWGNVFFFTHHVRVQLLKSDLHAYSVHVSLLWIVL